MKNTEQAFNTTDSDHDKHQNLLKRKAARNLARAMKLEQSMYDYRSRYLILVITLSYKPEWQHLITLDTLRKHRNYLLNNRRCNELLQGINGYVWKIEEGQNSGGLHLHVVIFYDGDHRADVYITQRIGDYWSNVVTEGMGTYWNSNADKDMHQLYGHGIGTGQIDRFNSNKREALRKNLSYLAKNDQHVTGRYPHYRMFGTSHLPK
jgi:hypothetical protein